MTDREFPTNEMTNKKYYDLRDEFWNNLFSPLSNAASSNMMKTDIKEKDNSYILAVDIPGIKKEEIILDLEDGYLTIKVDHADEKRGEECQYIRQERFIGSCSRSFYVGDVDKEKIEANIADGVLVIVLPKERPENKNSRINIK